MTKYTVKRGYDELPDGDYEYYGVFDPQGNLCGLFYVDAIPNAKQEAQDLADRMNNND